MWKHLAALLKISLLRRVWYAPLWAIQNLRSGPRSLSVGERRALATMQAESARRERLNRSLPTRENEAVQRLAYAALWSRTISAALTQIRPPEVLDPRALNHVSFALSVIGGYDATRESSGAFVDCLYRPMSDLPYPHAEIRRCCEFLIAIADADPASQYGEHAVLVSERDALGFALFSLNYFLDLPAGEMPRQKLRNMAYARHGYRPGTKSHATPRPGDAVRRAAPGQAEPGGQVPGVGDNTGWMC